MEKLQHKSQVNSALSNLLSEYRRALAPYLEAKVAHQEGEQIDTEKAKRLESVLKDIEKIVKGTEEKITGEGYNSVDLKDFELATFTARGSIDNILNKTNSSSEDLFDSFSDERAIDEAVNTAIEGIRVGRNKNEFGWNINKK
jgi:hypothetical protein